MQHNHILHLCMKFAVRSYYFNANAVVGFCRVGRHDAKGVQDIQLSGTHILDEHCYFESVDGTCPAFGDERSLLSCVSHSQVSW